MTRRNKKFGLGNNKARDHITPLPEVKKKSLSKITVGFITLLLAVATALSSYVLFYVDREDKGKNELVSAESNIDQAWDILGGKESSLYINIGGDSPDYFSNTIKAERIITSNVLLKSPNNIRAKEILGICKLRLGKLDEAYTIFLEILSRDPEYYRAYNDIGIIWKLRNELDKAEESYNKAISINPDFPQAISNRAWILYNKGNGEEALKVSQKYSYRMPYMASLRILEGHVYLDKGLEEDAKNALTNALKYDPDNIELLVSLARTWRLLAKYDLAKEYLDKAITLDKNNCAAYLEYGALYAASNESIKSIEYFSKYLEKYPTDFSALTNRIILFERIGNDNKALDDAIAAVKSKPNSSLGLSNLAISYSRIGKNNEALEHATDALKGEGVSEFSFYAKSAVLNSLGRYEEALTDAERAIKHSPNSVWGYIAKARVLASLKKYDESMESLNYSSLKDSDFFYPHYIRGVILEQINENALSLISLSHAIKLQPDQLELYMVRGKVLEKIGRYDSALEDYRQYIGESDIHPDVNRKVIYLMSTCVKQGLINREAALDTAKQLIKTNGSSWENLLALAAAYAANADFISAIKYQNLAIKNLSSENLTAEVVRNQSILVGYTNNTLHKSICKK